MNLEKILEDHKAWIKDPAKGGHANLSRADLSQANLIGADLSRANLSHTNLSRAGLSHANLSHTNLSQANLIGADLSHANLIGTDLSRANLSGAIGNGREIKSLQMEYFITYTHDRLQIGCQNHPIDHWWTLSADDVEEMKGGAGELWGLWKPILKTIIETSPARKP